MATSIVSARVTLGAPGIQRYGNELRLDIPLMNVGEGHLQQVQITSVSLGSATRTSPPGMPIVLGTLAASSASTFAARFSDAGLVAGSNLALTVRGSYIVNGIAYGLTVNRYLRVPDVGGIPPSELRARIEVSTSTNYWNYRIVNTETAGSPQKLVSLSLSVNAPVTVTATPPGWFADTDNMSYVLWIATDPAPPYPNHVGPGASLAGFQLMSPRTKSEATGASLAAWDHGIDEAGKVLSDYTLTPSRGS
jgi:hypothetical protein